MLAGQVPIVEQRSGRRAAGGHRPGRSAHNVGCRGTTCSPGFRRDALAGTLADHDEVACHWYVGGAERSAEVERRSAGNLMATCVNGGRRRDGFVMGNGRSACGSYPSDPQRKTIR